MARPAPFEIQLFTPEGRVHALAVAPEGPLWIGRDGICDVIARSPTVSRRHVCVERCDEGFKVTDHSSNGTYVNGIRLRQAHSIVHEELELCVGPYRMRIRDGRHTATIPKPCAAPESQVQNSGDQEPASDLERDVESERLDDLFEALFALIEEPEISAIEITNLRTVFVVRNGRLERTELCLEVDAIQWLIERLLEEAGTVLSDSRPLANVRHPRGFWLSAILPPLSARGPCLTIMKPKRCVFSLEDLVRAEVLRKSSAELLLRAVRARKNIVVCGGSEDDTLPILNALAAAIPASERVIAVEERARLELPQQRVTSLVTRAPNLDGSGEYAFRAVLQHALRMQSDRVIVSGAAGTELFELISAMSNCRAGTLLGVQASSTVDLLNKLELGCLLRNAGAAVVGVRRLIAASVQLIVEHVKSERSVTEYQLREIAGIGDSGEWLLCEPATTDALKTASPAWSL